MMLGVMCVGCWIEQDMTLRLVWVYSGIRCMEFRGFPGLATEEFGAR